MMARALGLVFAFFAAITLPANMALAWHRHRAGEGVSPYPLAAFLLGTLAAGLLYGLRWWLLLLAPALLALDLACSLGIYFLLDWLRVPRRRPR